MKVLFATSEAQPFAGSGGLGDVAGSLPQALVKEGVECSVIMPYYVNTVPEKLKSKLKPFAEFYIPVGWRSQYCGILCYTDSDKVTYYLIDNEYYFKRDFGIYGYYDDAERFAFFSRAVLETVQKLSDPPDIIHSNDWQTALIPVYFNIYYRFQHNMRNIRNVFTIHNIKYQGRYGFELLEDVLSIPRHMGRLLEYNGDVNFMKGAFEIADKITTVSPTYSEEILDPYFSEGLNHALMNKKFKTCGFLNGIDMDLFNPATDKTIAKNFSATKPAGKKDCKEALLKGSKFAAGEEFDGNAAARRDLASGDEPILGIVARLDEIKGVELIKSKIDEIIALGYKVVMLGSGEKTYEDFFRGVHDRYPDKVRFVCGYIPSLAKKIYAGADMFLMPSRSEPCGLAQMISLRYGTIPVVHAVGGLKDSVIDYGEENGVGFTFRTFNGDDMVTALKRAYDVYQKPSEWSALVKKAMQVDFSWKASAKLYKGLYEELYSWEKH